MKRVLLLVLAMIFSCTVAQAQKQKKDQLKATAGPAGSVTLNWTQSVVLPTCGGTVTTNCCNPACPVLANRVYRGTTAGGEATTPLATLTAPSTTYNDATTAPGQTYFYVVTASNNVSESGKSNEVSVTIPIPTQGAAPNAPTGLTGVTN